MTQLAAQRCFNHADREAAARCISCRSFFCRECAAEHSGRVLCAACLRKIAAEKRPSTGRFTPAARAIPLGLAILGGWFFFYLIGEVLLAIPSKFHNGTLWESNGDPP